MRHVEICQVVAELDEHTPGINSNSDSDHSILLRGHSILHQCNIGSTQSFMSSQLEQESLERLQSQDIHDSLPLVVRITSTSGLAATFDPDLCLQSGQHPEAAPGWESENLQTTGGPSNQFPNFIFDMPEDLICKDWMKTTLSGFAELDTQHFNASLTTESMLRNTTTTEPWSGRETEHATASDPLFEATKEIVGRLNSSIINKAPNSPIRLIPSAALSKCAADFFSPHNLRRFIDRYWSTWYTHWPVIHRPTFVYHKVPYTLIAGMALIGASYSIGTEDRGYAKYFCDAVEEMIFGDEYFGDSSSYSVLNAVYVNRRLRALQAAHAMCLYQFWEGDERGRRRVRKHRFGQVVAVSFDVQVSAGLWLRELDGSRIGLHQSHTWGFIISHRN